MYHCYWNKHCIKHKISVTWLYSYSNVWDLFVILNRQILVQLCIFFAVDMQSADIFSFINHKQSNLLQKSSGPLPIISFVHINMLELLHIKDLSMQRNLNYNCLVTIHNSCLATIRSQWVYEQFGYNLKDMTFLTSAFFCILLFFIVLYSEMCILLQCCIGVCSWS